MTVCTGSLVLAQTGVLDRYHVTANKMGLKMVVDTGKLNGAVRWVGDTRWVKDRRVWSAARVAAGIHLAPKSARTFFDYICKGNFGGGGQFGQVGSVCVGFGRCGFGYGEVTWVCVGRSGVDAHRIDSNATTVDSGACIPQSSTQVGRLSGFQDGVFALSE